MADAQLKAVLVVAVDGALRSLRPRDGSLVQLACRRTQVRMSSTAFCVPARWR
jgi:hypothetical protein